MAARQPGYEPRLAIARFVAPTRMAGASKRERGKRNGDGGAPHLFGVPIEPRERRWRNILRKEVIQPQVPLRLPCYDFTPVADPTVVGCLHCWLAHRLRVEPTPMV